MTPEPVRKFLAVATPEAWLAEAVDRLPELLADHANCELKAASTALGFIYRYPAHTALVHRMSRLAREELRHFEQVRQLMEDLSLPFRRTSASRYASALRSTVRPEEPARLLDMLLVGALIEARSCERFAALAARLPARVGRFYAGLLASEARHFEHYVDLAKRLTPLDTDVVVSRITELRAVEGELITAADPQFRFHSGLPVAAGI